MRYVVVGEIIGTSDLKIARHPGLFGVVVVVVVLLQFVSLLIQCISLNLFCFSLFLSFFLL